MGERMKRTTFSRSVSTAVLLLPLLLPVPASAAGLSSLVSETHTGAPSIIFYEPLCDVEAAADCAVVELICGDYARLTMWLNDFDHATLAGWLTASEARSVATTAFGEINFLPYEILFSDLNASWNIKLYAAEDPAAWLQALADDPQITITTGKVDLIVPDSPKGIADLQTFAASCAKDA